MSETKVMACDCVVAHEIRVKSGMAKQEDKPRIKIPWYSRGAGAEYQDARFGRGNRLHNIGRKGQRVTATCTVCGRTKEL